MSLAKQNFSNVVEDAINQQVAMEMAAAHTYLAISAYMGSDSVALPGLEKFFREQSEEEREHAQNLMDYQNTRGGQVVLQTVPAPEFEWRSAKNAVESALQLEKDVNKSLLRIESLAEDQNDAEFVMHLRTKFLKEQVAAIEDISKLITQLNRVGGDALGLYLFDQTLLKEGIDAIVG
ncbi:hypothetical protein BG000_012077 [Podila horticola]|nr:hypothetical protein BG003_011191 [Podila horticola]KAG0329513.1 hypothetical protein BG000_012077 [Podila horticola]